MTERPILFSAPMVLAILAGTKTQTRRALKTKGTFGLALPEPVKIPGHRLVYGWDQLEPGERCPGVHCPYGDPGDQLWVREAFHHTPSEYEPLMSMSVPLVKAETAYRADYPGDSTGLGWKPSIHMPRKLCRIELEITGVRIERLQDISEADAKAEGCERLCDDEPGYVERDEPDWKLCPRCGGTRLYTSYGPNGGACFDTDCTLCDTYAKRYEHLWESINGAGSWALNPWVWVVKFRRLKP